jgi:hypothetical protein
LKPINAYPLMPPDRNLLPEFPSALEADGRISGWRYCASQPQPYLADHVGETNALRYGTSGKQQPLIATDRRNDVAMLCITHHDSAQWTLESPLITLAGTQIQSVRMHGRMWRNEGRFIGTVMFQLVTYAEKDDGTLEQVAVNSFDARSMRGEPDGILGRNRKIDFPKRVTHLRFRVEATFWGVLELEQPVLTAEPTVRRGG